MSSAIAAHSLKPASAARLARREAIRPLYLRKLFADDPARGESLAFASADVYPVGSLRGCGRIRALGDKGNE